MEQSTGPFAFFSRFLDLGIDDSRSSWLDDDMTKNPKHIGTFGTSQMHEFLPRGYRYQWHRDHNDGECVRAFMRYTNSPDAEKDHNWLMGL